MSYKEVMIDGVRYVPVIEAHASMKAVARGLLASFWGHVGDDKDLAEKIEGITVRVFDDGTGEPIEKVLADIAIELGMPMRAPEPAQADELDAVRDLLAVIHGDGGHHTAAAGLAQSADDAARIVIALRARLAAAEAAARERGEALRNLRGFAQRIMQNWPEGDVDGGELQDAAEAHGLLTREDRTDYCGDEEACSCCEQSAAFGCMRFTCFRTTALLTAKEGRGDG